MAKLEFVNSKTPYSSEYEDVYFSALDGIEESNYVYLEGSGFKEALNQQAKNPQPYAHFCIGEIGFGVGLNFLLTVKYFMEQKKEFPALNQNSLTYLSFEKSPISAQDLETLYTQYPELTPYAKKLLQLYPLLTQGFHPIYFPEWNVKLILSIGDATQRLKQLHPGPRETVQFWYWDGFAPSKNPEAFQKELFYEVTRLSAPQARGASFTVAGWVRENLSQAGFIVQKRKGFGNKRECLVAILDSSKIESSKVKPSNIKPWFSSKNLSYLEPHHHVAIVGAGFSGTALVRELKMRGIKTTLIDPHKIANRASGNVAGIFTPQFSKLDNPISLFSKQSLAYFLRELKNYSPHEVPVHYGVFKPCDIVGELDSLEEILHQNYPLSFYEKTHLQNHEGYLFKECGVLSPKKLCEARAQGVPLLPLQIDDQTFYSDEFKNYSFDHIIFAGGADMAHGSPVSHFYESIPLRKVRGQVLYAQPTLQSKKIPYTLMQDGYITPSLPELFGTDQQLIGATYSTKLPPSPDKENEQILLDQTELLNTAQKYWSLNFEEKNVISHQVGYRLSTPDKLPLIGPAFDSDWLKDHYSTVLRGGRMTELPDLEVTPQHWLFLAMSSRGMTFSSLGAHLLVSLMLGEILPIEYETWEHLHSTRFCVRNLKRS